MYKSYFVNMSHTKDYFPYCLTTMFHIPFLLFFFSVWLICFHLFKKFFFFFFFCSVPVLAYKSFFFLLFFPIPIIVFNMFTLFFFFPSQCLLHPKAYQRNAAELFICLYEIINCISYVSYLTVWSVLGFK